MIKKSTLDEVSALSVMVITICGLALCVASISYKNGGLYLTPTRVMFILILALNGLILGFDSAARNHKPHHKPSKKIRIKTIFMTTTIVAYVWNAILLLDFQLAPQTLYFSIIISSIIILEIATVIQFF